MVYYYQLTEDIHQYDLLDVARCKRRPIGGGWSKQSGITGLVVSGKRSLYFFGRPEKRNFTILFIRMTKLKSIFIHIIRGFFTWENT